jgi:hypothetical protein
VAEWEATVPLNLRNGRSGNSFADLPCPESVGVPIGNEQYEPGTKLGENAQNALARADPSNIPVSPQLPDI